jgi:hypothetical protein
LAEHEYYTIAFPDNIDLYRLEPDNVEFNSFYSDENLLISNSKTTQKKLLSKSQLIFIGKAFQNRIISRNNKVNILQYIFKSVEGAMALKMRSSRNYRALPFLLALLSIVNGLVEFKEAGNNLDDIDWDTELAETVMKIVQYCWRLDDLLLRITCGLIYAKVTKVAEPSSVAKYAE